eukprot:s546_g2.t1
MLSDTEVSIVDKLRSRVETGKAIPLGVQNLETWLIFTDGACEGEEPSGSVGGVLVAPNHRIVHHFGDQASNDVMSLLLLFSSHPIHELEMIPVLISFHLWGHLIRGSQVVHYIDNESVRLALLRGSGETAVARMVAGKIMDAEYFFGTKSWLALADMRELLRGGSNSVSLDERTCKAVELLKEKLSLGRPRTLRITKKKKPIVLFTDGSLEYEDGLPVARIGGVCLLTDGTNLVFGAEVSSDLLQSWTEGGDKEHVIGLVEMYAVLVALNTWADKFAGERILLFVDNWPVVDALVKGVSTQSTWRDLLMVFEVMDEKHQSLHWVGRVPSASNPADPPSRGTLEGLEFLGELMITECYCPISNKQLKRIVNVNAEAE